MFPSPCARPRGAVNLEVLLDISTASAPYLVTWTCVPTMIDLAIFFKHPLKGRQRSQLDSLNRLT